VTAFEPSQHARRVLAGRGIHLEWEERALAAPAELRRYAVDPELMHALLPIDERQGRVLRVVYASARTPRCAITAFFDRRARRIP
jgi:hypothetical protein